MKATRTRPAVSCWRSPTMAISPTASCSRSSSHSPASRRPRLRRDPHPVGAALRGHPDQGRRRDPPFLSPNDEFADYETWDQGNLDLSEAKRTTCCSTSTPVRPCRLGLQLEQKLGVNPYKFGMIGSTDSHTGLATAAGGQLLRQALRRGAERRSASSTRWPKLGDQKYTGWAMVASGFAAVWATREHPRGASSTR